MQHTVVVLQFHFRDSFHNYRIRKWLVIVIIENLHGFGTAYHLREPSGAIIGVIAIQGSIRIIIDKWQFQLVITAGSMSGVPIGIAICYVYTEDMEANSFVCPL